MTFIPDSAEAGFDSGAIARAKEALGRCDPMAPGSSFRGHIKEALEDAGWSGKVNLEHDTKRYIDGVFRGVGLVVQTGNKGAATSYLMNLEHMYVTGKIDSAIFVTQTRDHAVRRYELFSNPGSNSDGNYCTMERISSDVRLFSSFLRCPICIMAIEG